MMTDILTNPSRTDLFEAMQSNYIAYFRCFAGLPGVEFHEARDATWVIAEQAPGRHVLRTRITAVEVETRIEEILDQISGRTDSIRWLVFAGDRPNDLGRRLEAHGLTADEGDAWMLADLSLPSTGNSGLPEVRIELVRNEVMLREWFEVSAAGFGMSQKMIQVYYEAYARHGFGPEAISLHYIGYLGSRPATSATLLLADGLAGIFDVSTPLQFRRRGLGTAITAFVMAEARRRGYRYAYLQAFAAGVGVYRQLGFIPQFKEQQYFWMR